MPLVPLEIDPIEIKQIFDGKNWKTVDTAYRAVLIFTDSPLTKIPVLVADLVGGGNDISVWRIEDMPPLRFNLP